MEERKKATIEKVYQLTKQDAEFNEELRKRLGITTFANSAVIDDERLNQIYEYCIEKIIRKQAEDFYKDFPVVSIIPTLIDDYVRMESFHRKDNFGDFCLALYQQIECMTNKICESQVLTDITEKMWGCEAYVKIKENKQINIYDRIGSFTIANLLFPGDNKKTGLSNAVEKSRKTLQNQFATDKIRIIVYFYGFHAKMKSSEFESFLEITGLLNDIYQCRNMNHRGSTLTSWEEETLNRIIPMRSFYYFKFLGVLAQYVDYIKTGTSEISKIELFARSIEAKRVEQQGPKIVGKIDLSDFEKYKKKR